MLWQVECTTVTDLNQGSANSENDAKRLRKEFLVAAVKKDKLHTELVETRDGVDRRGSINQPLFSYIH